MDQQSSARWLETLKAEARTKAKWEHKYLTEEQQRREAQEVATALSELGGSGGPVKHTKSINERDAMAMRLKIFDDEENDPGLAEKPPTKSYSQLLRERVAEEVARTRPRSHRFTGDLSTE